MLKFGLLAASVGLAVAGAVFAPSPGNATSSHWTFCRGGSPTPKHVCDALKAHDKARPTRMEIKRLKSTPAQAQKISGPRRQR